MSDRPPVLGYGVRAIDASGRPDGNIIQYLKMAPETTLFNFFHFCIFFGVQYSLFSPKIHGTPNVSFFTIFDYFRGIRSP